jgi:DNA-binding response OmpR family regulator
MAKVLVVDDNENQVDTLTAFLRMDGHVVRGENDAVRILAVVRDFNPDVVILDLAMPGKSGWQAAAEIREYFRGKRPRLIALSAEYTKPEHQVKAEMTGFDYYIVKPCDPNVLKALIERT